MCGAEAPRRRVAAWTSGRLYSDTTYPGPGSGAERAARPGT